MIHFPVEGNFVNLEVGTVELWVKMGLDASSITGELFVFMTYKRGTDAVFLQFDSGGIARMRIKSASAWFNADSAPLGWKEGEIHHMAGTWGPDGLKLYLDEELAGEDAFTGGPTVFAETFEINNASPPDPNFPTNCVVDEVRISELASINFGKDLRLTKSDNDGITWSEPVDITKDVKHPDWGWYATGPGVGIQLKYGTHKGRLVIPCDHREKIDDKWFMYSHVFYSDDAGET